MSTEVENLRLRLKHRDEEIENLIRLVDDKNAQIGRLALTIERQRRELAVERSRACMIERIAADERMARQVIGECSRVVEVCS